MSGPLWLVGGEAVPTVATKAATVWLVDLDDCATRERAEALALLPGEVEAVAGRRDAGERLLRRRLARLLLAAAGDCRADEVVLGRTDAGALVVRRPEGWHLSLAARWPLCAIGVAREPIGVDVEAVGEPLPDDMLGEIERVWMRARPITDLSHASACLWAAKEAHAKWTGRPRDLDPATIEAVPLRHPGLDPGSIVPREPADDARADGCMPGQARHDGERMLVTSRLGVTRCWLHDLDDHVAAVCVA